MTEEIGLREMIRQLRHELEQAMVDGDDSALKLRIDSIELELQVVVTRSSELGAGVKFWVVNTKGKFKDDDRKTQLIKLKVTPRNAHAETDGVEIAD